MSKANIEMGDYVRIKNSGRIGYVSGIKDYGTHVCYFIDLGLPLKYPAREEFIELYQKGDGNA